MKKIMDYYALLGIKPDSTREEVESAFYNNFRARNDIDAETVIDVYLWLKYEFGTSPYISKINILDNNKTCELLGINEATDDELEGIIRYISKSKFSSRKNCNELLNAISDGNFDTINQLLVGEHDDDITDEQIAAIYNYVIKETDYKMHRHVILWNSLMRNECIKIDKIDCLEKEYKKGER